jgi:hypothetical protein
LWDGWLVTFFVVFTAITTLWPYYSAALSPAAAAIIGAGAIAAVGVAATGVTLWSLAGRRPVPFAAALAAGLVAVALAPAVASVNLAAHSESAFDTPFESARVQEAVALGLGKQGPVGLHAHADRQGPSPSRRPRQPVARRRRRLRARLCGLTAPGDLTRSVPRRRRRGRAA